MKEFRYRDAQKLPPYKIKALHARQNYNTRIYKELAASGVTINRARKVPVPPKI